MNGFRGCANRARVIEILSELVAINSVNTALEGAAEGENDLARYVGAFCTKLGMSVELQEVQAGRHNVLARLDHSPQSRTLLFEGHLDTVTIANMPDGLKPRLKGDRLYGRGACDTKGGIAALLHALEMLLPHRDRLRANIHFLGAVDEEVTFLGIKHFLKLGGKADAAVVFEPTGLQPVIAHKGVVRIRIATQGRSAHTSKPELGDNAIYQMVEVIRALRDRVEARLSNQQHPLCGVPTLSVSRINGGLQINIVPPQCTIEIDRRTLPNEDPAEVLADFETFLAELHAEQPWIHATVESVLLQDWGLDTPVDAPIVGQVVTACRSILGKGQPLGVPYGTDASKLAKMGGVPCVVLGPGEIAQAHTADEWVDIGQVAAAAEIYAELAVRYA